MNVFTQACDRCGPRFACAQYFPVFFRNCSSLIRSVDSKQFGLFYAFAATCARLPGTQMVKALQAAKCKGDSRRRRARCQRHSVTCVLLGSDDIV